MLQPELAEGEAGILVAGLGPGQKAVTTGRLFAVCDPGGWYPAFVPDPAGAFVHGQFFEANGVDLAELDRFEQEGVAYDRRAIAVKPEGGRWSSAEAYCWRGATRGLVPIPHGSFSQWLAETGNTAFAG